jgi:hypothetical protein
VSQRRMTRAILPFPIVGFGGAPPGSRSYRPSSLHVSAGLAITQLYLLPEDEVQTIRTAVAPMTPMQTATGYLLPAGSLLSGPEAAMITRRKAGLFCNSDTSLEMRSPSPLDDLKIQNNAF